MNARKKINRIAIGALLVSFVGAMVTLAGVDRVRQKGTLQDVLYISSPRLLKRMSLGYTGLVSEIYWTRAVQYFGSRHKQGDSDYALLLPLLRITTELDPKLIVAYRFGANFLAPKPPEGAGVPDQAIALLEHGVRNNPENWKLYYDLGFIYYLDVKNYAKAAEVFEQGSRVPKAHPFLKVLAAQAAQHAGEIQTSRMLWEMTLATTKDKLIVQNAVDHLLALRVDEEVVQLEKLVAAYRDRTGRLPSIFRQLVDAGYLRRIPTDPKGYPYKLTADGRVELHDPDAFAFVEKGLPPGFEPTPYPERVKKKLSE